MAISNVVARGFGPGASIAFVTTRGFSIGAAIVTPPDATLTTRGYGANGTIGGIVTRFYSIGTAVVPPADNTSTVGFRWVTGPGRKKLIELYEAERAERELRGRLKKKKRVPDAIREAVSEAAAVIETAEHAPQTDQVSALLADLSKSLDAIRLNAAKSMAAEQALWAIEVARRLREEIAAQEDEEEAITLLLLH